MADAWGGSWGSAWGVSWGTSVTPPTPVRIYGVGFGGAPYRVKDRDVKAVLQALYKEPRRKRKRAARIREIERVAMALLEAPPSALPEIRRVIIDFAGPLLRAREGQAELQTLIEAMLQQAAIEAEAARAAFEEDEEDVMLLLGATL
jgi:hypothetical protein